ncbi:MAG: hypothetical protein Q9187_002601 [Circinaria calcarea]
MAVQRLVQHLINKEKAIDDVVKGYEQNAQAHNDDYGGYLVHTRNVGEDLVSSFQGRPNKIKPSQKGDQDQLYLGFGKEIKKEPAELAE